ncbi:MAG TPA: purine-nucleoside phosphorylase [Flavitalea sp.]|nr:purine-nucleoside phosphorylase [Flavitalea sp.]
MTLTERLKETTAFINKQWPHKAEAGIILGSGLGNFSSKIKIEKEIEYSSIPHFPVATVEGHTGRLIAGEAAGKKIIAMAGRFHFYEGYSAKEVVYPVQVMGLLGIKHLLIANAAGGVNPAFRVGDLMIIRDHISLAVVNPLLGRNEDELGPRFPDMSEPYNARLIALAQNISKNEGIPVHEGVYFGVTGPTFETRAEYKMIRTLGGDAVGMSTVQEVVTAVHLGLSVFAMSVITDIGIRSENNTISHQDVLEAARNAEPRLTTIFMQLLEKLDKN